MPPLLLIAAVVGHSAPASTTLSAADRTPAAVVVLTPFGSQSSVGTSRLIRAVGEILDRRTDLHAQSSEQSGIDAAALAACPARQQLTCWTRRLAAVRPAHRTPARYLFVLAVRRADAEHDRVAITMLDPSVADRLLDAITPDELETAIFQQTPRTSPIIVSSRRGSDLVDRLDQAFSQAFAAPLTAAGQWQPYGQATLSSTCDNCEVLVDGRLVGLSRAGPLRIEGLRGGSHTVNLRRGGQTVRRCEVQTSAGTHTDITDAMCPRRPSSTDNTDLWLRYGGMLTAAAGIAFLTYGAVQAADAPRALCLIPEGSDRSQCDSIGAPGIGFSSDGAITDRVNDVNPSGIPTAAIGAGLLGAGATWTAGSWFWEDWPPWAQATLGAAIGAAAFGVGVAAGNAL